MQLHVLELFLVPNPTLFSDSVGSCSCGAAFGGGGSVETVSGIFDSSELLEVLVGSVSLVAPEVIVGSPNIGGFSKHRDVKSAGFCWRGLLLSC
jgi:hypothetical protein